MNASNPVEVEMRSTLMETVHKLHNLTKHYMMALNMHSMVGNASMFSEKIKEIDVMEGMPGKATAA